METKQVIASIMGAALVAGSLFGAATVLTDQGSVQVDQVSSVETVEPSTELVELEVGAVPAEASAVNPGPSVQESRADAVMAANPYPAVAPAEYEEDEEEDDDD